MKEVKPREYKDCKECGHRETISKEIYGCDCCDKEINLNDTEVDYLSATIHSGDGGAVNLYYCSWKCIFKHLKTQKCNYFISLPFLNYDSKGKGMTSKDFWKHIKQFKK